MIPRPPTVVIENFQPLVDAGRYPIKRAIGESVTVTADIFKDGHDLVSARVKWRKAGAERWHEAALQPVPDENDRWQGTFSVFENASYEFTVEAWGDYFRTWQHEFAVKHEAGQTDLQSETLEGAGLLDRAAKLALEMGQKADGERLAAGAKSLRESTPAEVFATSHEPEIEALMAVYSDRSESTEFLLSSPILQKLVESALSSNPVSNAPASVTPSSAPEKRGRAGKKKKAELRAPENAVEASTTQASSTAVTLLAATQESDASAFTPNYPRLYVDRPRAVFSQWYEFFPRSAEGRGDRGSTFRECLPRIDDAKAMGFDVIYFPPIHPIGVTARKGRNNSVTCAPGEPGVPYAIGNRHQSCPHGGGHKDVAPELGTLEDFAWLVREIHARGLELALDFAINCSPDHPYVHAHPEWFYQRPDGTIKYAENPPKKYQDVYPMNFHNPNWRALWDELASVVEFWCERGVRIFRVDNPHTKPVAFWEYLIARVQRRFADALFLSEAFTRPKMMLALAKAGFTHSYTYFTWRNTKEGLTEYFTELTQSGVSEVMRPNLWPNTPDILPSFLQFGGRPAFITRAVLAATLSSVYGIYSGFELCENAGLEKKPWNAEADVRQFLHLCDTDYRQLAKEEYLDSEKYQWKERDWNAPGNIKSVLTRLNAIRRENRALQQWRNLKFVPIENDLLLAFAKTTDARDNVLLIVVSLDPFHAQEAFLEVPLELIGLPGDQPFQAHDLLNDERYLWRGRRNFVCLTPAKPAHVFRLRRKTHSERDFDYFL